MENIIVFCETRNGELCDVSLELVTKARLLAEELGCKVDAIVIGKEVNSLSKTLFEYGVDRVFCADDERLSEYLTLPYTRIVTSVVAEQHPQIFLAGATNVGRDLAPRVAAELQCGITADCTELRIGECEDTAGVKHENILLQIRPNFVGNQLTTIVSTSSRPQMATMREGVVSKQRVDNPVAGEIITINTQSLLTEEDFAVSILKREVEARKSNLKGAKVVVAGGYGVGSRENFELLYRLAELLHGEVGSTRAAVDAGYCDHSTMIGQTGVTVRPKLYIAIGISGQVQHTVGMEKSGTIISINRDPEAPINKIADYVIVGDARECVTHLIDQLSK